MYKHTPTPWTSELSTIYTVGIENKEANNGQWSDECLVGSVINKADAAFTVRAVNAHDGLVKQLRSAIRWIENVALNDPAEALRSKPNDTSLNDLKRWIEAIAKAEGE